MAEDREFCPRCSAEIVARARFCQMCGSAQPIGDDDDPLLGTLIGERYRPSRRLGQGGSGTVYLAEHVALGRQVALKVLRHELTRDEAAIERFRREATTVGAIDNEHLVEVYDLGRLADGRLYLAMELLEGETLLEALRREGRLPVARAVDVLEQVGEALMEAHAMGYVHRDLRPANVFLARRRGRDGYVKLLDFGLAKLVEGDGGAAATALGMRFGQPAYLSPEQARGAPVDRRSDLYALGTVAYEMLVGGPPFAGGTPAELLRRHLEDPAPAPSTLSPDVPSWLDAVIVRALAKRPEERFATAFRFVEALRTGRDTGRAMSDEQARSLAEAPPEAPAAPRGRVEEDRSPGPSRAVAAPATVGPGVAAASLGASDDVEEVDERDALDSVPPAEPPALDDDAPPARRPAGAGARVGWIVGGLAVGAVVGAAVLLLEPRSAPDTPQPGTVAATDPGAGPSVRPGPGTPEARAAAPPGATGDPRPSWAAAPPSTASPPGPVGGERESLPLDPGQAEFFVKLGGRALRAGEADQAASYFRRARAHDPRNAQAIAGLGHVALLQERYDEAVLHLDAAARVAPREGRIHTLRGQALLAAGRRVQAAQAFQRALALDPHDQEASRGYRLATGAAR